MFSKPRFLAYVHKPSVYYLRRIIPDQKRKQFLLQLGNYSSKQLVSKANPIYGKANELMKQEKINQLMKYQNSFWWSPRFTPNRFVFTFLIPSILVIALMLYIRYVSVPKTMMQRKLKYGIMFPQLQSKGWLSGWYEEYMKKDKVLEYQMYTLNDMERLHKEGMLSKTTQQTIKKIQKKKSKFVRGDKKFVLNQFKTN